MHTHTYTYSHSHNSVILAVSAANVDLANSDSLKLVRSVDPQGWRTTDIPTRLDLTDAGTHPLDLPMGRVYPRKSGFIGVMSPSQRDIDADKSMSDALKSALMGQAQQELNSFSDTTTPLTALHPLPPLGLIL